MREGEGVTREGGRGRGDAPQVLPGAVQARQHRWDGIDQPVNRVDLRTQGAVSAAPAAPSEKERL